VESGSPEIIEKKKETSTYDLPPEAPVKSNRGKTTSPGALWRSFVE